MRSRASAAGFVLAGGESARMGRDKALLEIGGQPLVQRVAALVRSAAGSAAIVGEPARYGHLGFPVLADRVRGLGPLGGLLTALEHSGAEWNLVVACDMPALSLALLGRLLQHAETALDARCVAAVSGRGPEPLCAVYHRACLPVVRRAAAEGRLRMTDLLGELGPVPVDSERQTIENINTPAEWSAWQAAQSY